MKRVLYGAIILLYKKYLLFVLFPPYYVILFTPRSLVFTIYDVLLKVIPAGTGLS
jgi:hypothetical protein